MVEFAFFVTWSACLLQDRSLLMVTPEYFASVLTSLRYIDYSDALKNSFFPKTFSMWNSLPSPIVSSKTIEEFKALI